MKTAIDHVQEGMVLLAPVVDAKGRLILPKGEKLTGHVIGRLSRFGVTHVDVEGTTPAAGQPEAAPAPKLDEATLTAQIHARFGAAGQDERMILIRDAVTRQLLRTGVSKPI